MLRTVDSGRFEVSGLAGEGGMSLVYRGVDRTTGLQVAIKILREGVSIGDRFERESQLLAELDDPRVVGYVAHGTAESGQQYLVTEWLEGEPLSRRLEAGTLTVKQTVDLARRVAAILGRLHERGIVHRDVKPSNLFLRGGAIERVTLIDFGIARFHDPKSELTRTGVAVGTPGFMAPEQARGERDIDARADVFSLGCVVFRCLAGRSPFRGEDALAVQLKIILDETPRLRDARPGVPDGLDRLVTRMLAKARNDRPPDGNAVARELDRIPAITAEHAVVAVDGLTSVEQRLVSVIVMRPRGEAATLPGVEVTRRNHALAELAERHEARHEYLVDGVEVVTLTGERAATDQAVQAARCALAARDIRSDSQIAVATGVGVIVDGVLVGEAFDRAVALLAGRAGEIRLDPLTAGLLPPQFEIRVDERGPHLARERDQPEPIRTLLGRPTPFVGRRKELRIIEAVLDEVIGDRVARAAMLIGPAGIGKSRVRYEFMRSLSAAGHPAQVWLGRADALLAAAPFGLVAQALRRECEVWPSDPPEVRSAVLRGRLARHLPADQVGDVTTFLAEMIGNPLSDADRPHLRAARESARLMSERIAESWIALLRAECAARPLVLILEDVHWADRPSLQKVDEALAALADLPFMVLAVARPEVDASFPRLWDERSLQRIPLAPLTTAASAELVRDALGPDTSAAAIDRICERAAGNAFFLEELIRAESEAGTETQTSSPKTVVAVVQARLAALEPEARRVLRAASVFGRVFWRGAVEALVGGGEAIDTGRWLADLTAREVLSRQSETRIAGETQYAFRHVLVREAAYATLTSEDRVRGHRMAGEWLERAGEVDQALLAEHFEAGNVHRKAGPSWRAAAERALAGGDPDAALAYAGRAVACGAAGEELGQLELVQAAAQDWKGEYEAAERLASAALVHLPRGDRRWCRAVGLLARVLLNRGQTDQLRALGADLLALSRGGPPSTELVIASVVLVYALRMAGLRGEDDALLVVVEQQASPEARQDPTVRGYLALCGAVLDQSDIAADLVIRREAAACFAEAGDTIRARIELYNSYFDLVELGAYDDARRGLQAIHEWAGRRNLMSLVWLSRGLLAETLSRVGRAAEAIPALREIADEFRRNQSGRKEGATLIALGRAYLILGALDDAERELRRAIDVLEKNGRPILPPALASLARVELERGRPDAALALTRRAISEAESLGGLESGESIMYLTHAEALWHSGARGEARAAICFARDRIEGLAARIADPYLQRSYREAVEENARTIALAAEWGEA
jgi:tetratricopeptide (TPR) repeat protein